MKDKTFNIVLNVIAVIGTITLEKYWNKGIRLTFRRGNAT